MSSHEAGLLSNGFLTHGRTHIAISLLIILILLIVDRSYIKIGTIICMVCGGPIIDFFTKLIGFVLPQELPIWGRGLMLVLGCIIRLCVDGVFALIGFLLGGILGIGTLVCIALVGPVAGLFMPINEKAVNSLVTKAIAQKN